MRRTPILLLSVVPFSLAVFMGQTTTPATQPNAPSAQASGGPKAVAPPKAPSSKEEKAADDITDYMNAHRDELQPSLKAANFNPEGAAAEYLKLKALLPANLASELDAAVPVLRERRSNSQIAVDLGYINTALNEYLQQNHDRLPDHLGQLVKLVPSINVFFMPDAALPDEVKNGTPDQQSPWINMHTMFAFPASGARAGSIPAGGMLVYERPDVNPQKPRLAVLFGDGHVDTVPRADIEKTLTLR